MFRAMLPVVILAWTLAAGPIGGASSPSFEQGPASSVEPSARASGIEYTITADLNPLDPRWSVRLTATGLDRERKDVALDLPNWGEWTDVDSFYIRGLRCSPPIHRDLGAPARWTLEPPSDWDGSIDLTFSIPLAELGSQAHQRHGLLPWYVADPAQAVSYSLGFSTNTLPEVLVGGVPLVSPRSVTVVGPPHSTIASGWAGISTDRQSVPLVHGLEQSLIVIGTSPKISRAEHDGIAYEVAQFASGESATDSVLSIARSVVGPYTRSTGRAVDGPVRIFIVDKGGGQWIPHGILVQSPDASLAASPYFKHLVAHEIFHQWLGGYVSSASESLAWFKEGFTDYLSLWHLAHAGQVDPEWFAARLKEIDDAARASPAYGHASFADDSVAWRDGNGPNESLAYRGGAILALVLDARLRNTEHAGLPRLIGDLAGQNGGRYTLESIKRWMEENGIGHEYESFIVKPALPPLDEVLGSIGFRKTLELSPLTYTGIECDESTGSRVVTAIDPDGPAAAVGLRVGDVIDGFWPVLPVPTRLGGEAPKALRFGLNLFDPAAALVNIGVQRATEHLTLQLQPRSVPGGLAERYTPDAERVRAFLGREP